MKRSAYTCTILGMVATLAVVPLSGCHSSAGSAPVPPRQQLFSPSAGQHQASSIDGNPNLTPAQKAAAKASLQQEYSGAAR